MKTIIITLLLSFTIGKSLAQEPDKKLQNHSEWLHAIKPDYPIPYDPPTTEAVKAVLERVLSYLDTVTPMRVLNRQTGATITDFSKLDTAAIVERGVFSLTSYEWGVTYGAMLLAAEATGDKRFADYTTKRLQFLSDKAAYFKEIIKLKPELKQVSAQSRNQQLYQMLEPHALDDCGAVCAAMIKVTRSAAINANLRPLIDNYMQHIFTKEYRLPDGTLARNRPQKNTLWLDDMFMGIPSLAQMGKLTGQKKYYNDAVKQVIQYSKRMFNKEKGIYMHGWVQGMSEHPQFHWARANGWALMAMAELLDVLPPTHEGYPLVLKQFQTHAKGLVQYQSGSGFWHQLLDKTDSYLETSATAIYAFSMARGINRGWLDPMAYGPKVLLAWNAVSTKVNAQGQVEGTCVGTGLGFEPAFYYHRPVNVYAAHGYGPVLLAGSEILNMMKKGKFSINDSALQYNKN